MTVNLKSVITFVLTLINLPIPRTLSYFWNDENSGTKHPVIQCYLRTIVFPSRYQYYVFRRRR